MPLIVSEKQKRYFNKIQEDVKKIYDIAKEARKTGIDPSLDVECPPALDMAGRVETLVGPLGLAQKIREWKEKDHADQDEICFRAMDEIMDGKFGPINREDAVDRAVRVALAIKTEGVVSAPLEGIGKVKIRQNINGGPDYLSLYFAGPIRAAGGTVQAFAVLCADYVRKKMNIAEWKATEEEIERMVEEVKLYDRIMNLQYPSTNEEIAFVVRHLTIELNGEPTEDQEVSAHRDVPRIETNTVRGGPCLVLNDGILLKAKKIMKIIETRKISGWDWLKDLKKLATKEEGDKDKQMDYGGDNYKGNVQKESGNGVNKDFHSEIDPVLIRRKELDKKNPPLAKYIADVIGGRPVFAYPSRIGGHRLRYGRSRNTGLAACGFHPSQMIILERFLAIGTQIRIERPGKSSVVMPVTSLEPPIVLLQNGDVVQIWDMNEANKIADEHSIAKILFLGDILFGYGEFAENNHIMLPSGYVEEWWVLDLENAIKQIQSQGQNPYETLPDDLSQALLEKMIQEPFDLIPTGRQALEIACLFKIGIHPRYLDHWGNITGKELLTLREGFLRAIHSFEITSQISLPSTNNNTLQYKNLETLFQSGLLIENNDNIKVILEKAFVIHRIENDKIRLDPHRSLIFFEILGLGTFQKTIPTQLEEVAREKVGLDLFPILSSLLVHDKAPYYIGSRMGRPEKAKERKMRPPVHVLFPLGHDSELQRSFQTASGQPSIQIELCNKRCPKCGLSTFMNKCPSCGSPTEFILICRKCNKIYSKDQKDCPQCRFPLSYSSNQKIALKKYLEMASTKINKKIPNIKGVKGLTSEFKVPEPIEKGILRALNEVWVYKDGTIRVDAMDIPLTHFTCKEISMSVDTIHQLGYDVDIFQKPITDENQVIELKVQDILLTHHLADYFLHVANFVDDELEYLYGLPRFYRIKKKEDLIGHYFAGLAPHTSAAIVGRLIGFTYAESGYAHPFWQAAKRRNCFPGDSTLLLFLDGKLQRISFKELYETYFDNEIQIQYGFSKSDSKHNIKVISFNPETKSSQLSNIIDVIKTPSTDQLINIELRTGRHLTTTIDHPVIIVSENHIIIKKAFEIKVGDYFILPTINIEEKNPQNIDLLKEFSDPRFQPLWDILMIRGINDFFKKIILSYGLQKTAQNLNINKKTLSNYYNKRDSIPYLIVKKLLDVYQIDFSSIPDCLLGVKYDHTFIPRRIVISHELARLIGYYIAEGYYRKGIRCYQIELANREFDIREDMKTCIKAVFGSGLKINENKFSLVFSNHLIYLVFKEIFKISNSARTKRIPSEFLQLPLQFLSSLLAAYFTGDGSVDSEHPEISCSTFSKELSLDIDTALLRFGIYTSLYNVQRDNNIEYKLRIYGENLIFFAQQIGFHSTRKTQILNSALLNINKKDQITWGNNKLIPVHKVNILRAKESMVYSLHVEKFHTILINENIITHQCDGDEDGLMLLLECLLNFSMYYLPSKLGGKMDAPLVCSVRLDPLEVDGESHNVDYAARYPLQFYQDTQKYVKPNDMEKYMEIYKKVLNTEKQFEGCMFTHPTQSINFGPHKSAYTTFETMAEKIEAQLWLANTILAVDAQDVARKVISSHFTPDVLGNIRSYGTQGFRCVKCGQKFRRIPLKGVCTECGGKLLMTVNPGGITKYLGKAMKLINDFDLGAYTVQRWNLIQQYITSLTNNPRIKQKSIRAFFK